MKRFLISLVTLLMVSTIFAQTPTLAPTVLGCTNPAPAVLGAPTVFFSSCKTPAFLPLSTLSVLASISKSTPVWAHSFSGYAATDKLVACPIGAVVSGATCTANGVDASALVAQSNVASFSIVPQVVATTGTLTWTTPFQNTDGTTLTDLVSFNIYQGTTKIGSTDYGTTNYPVSGLTVGTSYSFSVTAVNSTGLESDKATLTQTATGPKIPKPVTALTLTTP